MNLSCLCYVSMTVVIIIKQFLVQLSLSCATYVTLVDINTSSDEKIKVSEEKVDCI
jgi:hypothetical protein